MQKKRNLFILAMYKIGITLYKIGITFVLQRFLKC